MTKSHARPHRPVPAPGAPDHEPAPVDIASESVAGEEDPGASVEPPASDASERDRTQGPPAEKRG